MALGNYIKDLAPKVLGYKLYRWHLTQTPPVPINFTYSVTHACQSRCKTCNVWKLYREKPELRQKELKLDEIEKIFKSMGYTYFFNISGGEPFLRPDLPEIVGLACKYLRPSIIHTPTNGIAPQLIEKKMREILDIIKESGKTIPFTIKPSFDGIGPKHDEIRGVKGNFEKVLDTLARLKALQKEYPNLEVGLGTVVSNFNYKSIEEIAEYAKKLGIDRYINEIAEQRSELFTHDSPITPSPEVYHNLIKYFSNEIKRDLKTKSPLVRSTQAIRLVYYDLVSRTMKEKRQVIPCYAGLASAHLNAWGDLWPCCILGYDKPMGNLRDYGYDFKKLWGSPKANEIRAYIRAKKCYCPLANVNFTNILCNPYYMALAIKKTLL